MGIVRTYFDFSDEEVLVIKSLYSLCKSNNGKLNHNLKKYIDIIDTDIIVTNNNILTEAQLIHFITLICVYLFNMHIEGVEYNHINNVIRFNRL